MRRLKRSTIDQVAGMMMFIPGLNNIEKLKEACSRHEHFSLNQHIKNVCECDDTILALLEIDNYAIELMKDMNLTNVDMITKFNIVYKEFMQQVIRDEMPAILRRIQEIEEDDDIDYDSEIDECDVEMCQ